MWSSRLTGILQRLPGVSAVRGSVGHAQRGAASARAADGPIMTRLRKVGVGGTILLVVPVTCTYLGMWQVRRRKWKLDLIQSLESQAAKAPISLPTDLSALKEMEYEPVEVRGRFDHSREVYVGPRTLKVEKGGMLGASPPKGYHVVTPFVLADRDLTIMVNRGWVPTNKMDPSTRAQGQTQGEITLTGVVRNTEPNRTFQYRGRMGGETSRVWAWREVEDMSDFLGVAPVFLDAHAGSGIPPSAPQSVPLGDPTWAPMGGQTVATLRNDHLSYLITWFFLAGVTSVLWARNYLFATKTNTLAQRVSRAHK